MLMPTTTPGDLDPVDREALQRAVQTLMKDKDYAAHLVGMLQDTPWVEVAKFAAYSCQITTLDLKPWQDAPCHGYLLIRGRVVRDRKAGKLADQLTAAGLSVWEPNPRAALAKVATR